MEIAIVKYNAGNIQSVLYALERIGATATVTDNLDVLRKADKIIFPGVGEASTAMQYLRERKLDQLIKELQQPVLGICLGMQLMCTHSAENDTRCLGIFEEYVQSFHSLKAGLPEADQHNYKIPQMGWNTITDLRTPLFEGVPENSYCYFVHSYYAAIGPDTIAKTD
jgi:glutamine amidotransferase